MHKNRATGCRGSPGEAPRNACPPLKNPTCAALEKYGKVPETVPLDFTEDDVTWVVSNLSGTAGALGAEAMELQNWLLCFRCASEELRVVVDRLTEWMSNSSPPWAAYCTLMACSLVALDKRLGVRPVGIGKTISRALAKLVTRAAGDQAKTACWNLQLCAGLKAGIEGATHAVGQRRLDWVQRRRQEEEEEEDVEEEEESGRVKERLNNLTIEMEGTGEEAEEQQEVVLDMEVEEIVEVEEGGEGNPRALVALEFLTQYAYPSGTTIVDAHNGFNELSRLAMLWTVRHRWPEGERFAFNFYRHWAQLLLRQPGEPPVKILSREGVTQGDLL